jgi:hypothetical protein
MKVMAPVTLCAAGMLLFGAPSSTAMGQSDQASASASAAAADQITVTGCVQREADYRKSHDDGRGGVAGTGVGAGNEFVLVDASKSASGSSSATATGTSGSAEAAYELTGPNEGKVGSYINKRVEIMGKLKAAEVAASGAPTGGATAGDPPKGVDVVSKDLKLRELEVSSVREASGTCPAK